MGLTDVAVKRHGYLTADERTAKMMVLIMWKMRLSYQCGNGCVIGQDMVTGRLSSVQFMSMTLVAYSIGCKVFMFKVLSSCLRRAVKIDRMRIVNRSGVPSWSK